MTEIIDILNKLNSTQSLKDKENILISNKYDEELKTLLELNLNPYKQFQFNKLPPEIVFNCSCDKFPETTNFKLFLRLIENLEKRKVTGNFAKFELKEFFNRTLLDEFQLYKKILLKEPLGVSTKTVNKVWPNLIPKFELMLAPNTLAEVDKLNFPCIVQPKLDGFRAVFSNGKFISRSGKSFSNKNLLKYFKSLNEIGDVVLDGELYDHNLSFQQLTKILNAEEAVIPDTLKYTVYDFVKQDQWNNQNCSVPYEDRLKSIRILTNYIAEHKKIIDISSDVCNNMNEVLNLYKKYLHDKYEGIMIKDPNGIYKWKRVTVKSGEMLKLKPFKSEDIPIMDLYEGNGKYKGKAGGIIVKFKDTCVKVGTGAALTDGFRAELWKNPEKYIGKVAEIKYFEITEAGSLRHPVFERLREDK